MKTTNWDTAFEKWEKRYPEEAKRRRRLEERRNNLGNGLMILGGVMITIGLWRMFT